VVEPSNLSAVEHGWFDFEKGRADGLLSCKPDVRNEDHVVNVEISLDDEIRDPMGSLASEGSRLGMKARDASCLARGSSGGAFHHLQVPGTGGPRLRDQGRSLEARKARERASLFFPTDALSYSIDEDS
jgi:hypothetical protein